MIDVIPQSCSFNNYTSFLTHITTCSPIRQPQYRRGYKSLTDLGMKKQTSKTLGIGKTNT